MPVAVGRVVTSGQRAGIDWDRTRGSFLGAEKFLSPSGWISLKKKKKEEAERRRRKRRRGRRKEIKSQWPRSASNS